MSDTATLAAKPNDRLAYGVAELAQAIGVSKSLIRLEISRGRLRAVHAGQRVLIPAASIEAWLNSRAESK